MQHKAVWCCCVACGCCCSCGEPGALLLAQHHSWAHEQVMHQRRDAGSAASRPGITPQPEQQHAVHNGSTSFSISITRQTNSSLPNSKARDSNLPCPHVVMRLPLQLLLAAAAQRTCRLMAWAGWQAAWVAGCW